MTSTPKLPSFTSSFAESFKVFWNKSKSSSQSSSQAGSSKSSSSAFESDISHVSSSGARRRKSYIPQPAIPHSRETSQTESSSQSFNSRNFEINSHQSDSDSVPRTYQQHSENSRETAQQRSEENYVQSFTISSRLKRAFHSPTKTQTAIGFLILIIIVVTIVVGLVVGLRNVSLQDDLRNRINTIPVRTPKANETIIGHIKGQPPQKREFFFVLDERLGSPDGIEKDMFVVNGQYPGPILEVNQGDQVVVNVKNNLSQPSSIHWKGLFQSGTNYFDGVAGVTECGIPAGEEMSYKFQTDSFTGTTYWKAGYGTQATDGLTGGFVVHPTHSNTSITYDEEVMIHLSDLYHEHSSVLTAEYLSAEGIGGKAGNEPVPDSGTINGIGQYPHKPNGEVTFPSYYKLVSEPSKSYRLRLVNAGTFAPIKFSIDSHNLTVIEADGVEVEPITFMGSIHVEVGQRYSVVVHADKAHGEQFWMRASLVTDEFKYHKDQAVNEVLGIMAYGEELEGVPKSKQESNEVLDVNRLRPLVPSIPPPATETYIVNYLLNQSADGNTVGMFNSTTWSPLHSSNSLSDNLGEVNDGPSVPKPYQFLISVNKQQVIDLIIENLSGGTYPFSLNGHRPWIIQSGSGRYNPSSLNNSVPASSIPGGPISNQSHVDFSSNSSSSSPSSSSPLINSQTNQSTDSIPKKNKNIESIYFKNNDSSNENHHLNLKKMNSSTSAYEKSQKKNDGSHSFNTNKSPPLHSSNGLYTSSRKKKFSPSRSNKKFRKIKHAAFQAHEPYKGIYTAKSKNEYMKQDPNTIRYERVRRQMSNSSIPIQRDTFIIPKDGWVVLRFVADNPGIWLLSDQNLWHLAAGSAMQISSRKAEWSKTPDEIQKFCKSSFKLTT